MIIQEKGRSMESRPFISLSRKAFFFWCTFVMGLFAVFFFAGTLVGRGQIQVDLGQNELFKEITGLSEPQAPAEPDNPSVGNQAAEEPSDFEFYNNLASKEPDKSMDVTIQPSSKKKTKQVIKKNLDVVKPDELEGAQTVASTESSSMTSTAVKPQRDPDEPVKTESVSSEKVKSDATSKPRKDTVEKTVVETPAKPKTESAEKPKSDPVQTVKADTVDKSKTETVQKSKPASSDKTKASSTAKDKDKEKDKATTESSAEKSKKPEKPQPAEKNSDTGKKFSLQVAALKSESDAADMVKKLNGLGFSAYTVKSGDGEVWYKVRVGSFKDRTDAEKTISKLKNKNFDAFIVTR